MAVAYTITAGNADAIERQLLGYAGRFGDLTELMDRFGIVLETSTIERFDESKAPDGSTWARSRRAEEDGGKTLILSGRLRQSIAYRASRDKVEIGSNVIYARRHQEGFDGEETVRAHVRRVRSIFGRRLASPMEVAVGSFRRASSTPARPFLGVSAADAVELVAQGEDWLAEMTGEAQ